jgi:hypothetical protein
MRKYCLLDVIVSLCLHADLEMLGMLATSVGMDWPCSFPNTIETPCSWAQTLAILDLMWMR